MSGGGVRIVGVSDGGFPEIRCRYEVQREMAIAAILRDWHAQSGIKSVVIVRGARASAQEEMLETLIEGEGLAYEFKSAGSQRRGDFL